MLAAGELAAVLPVRAAVGPAEPLLPVRESVGPAEPLLPASGSMAVPRKPDELAEQQA